MIDVRRVKLLRGKESTRLTITPQDGEQIFTTDEIKLYIGDGIKPGGYVVNADNTLAICADQSAILTKHSLAWWINKFNGTEATIRVPKGIHNILNNVTVPSNICLKFDKGAVFNIVSGVTLTVNSDIDAGLWETYIGDGTVTGSAYHPTKPESSTPNYTDNSKRIATTKYVKDVLYNSPSLSGIPTAPTATLGTNTTQIATTAYIKNVLDTSPSLLGIPTAPTATTGTNTTQIATTAYVKNVLDTSPSLLGVPTAPTAELGTNTTQIANTSYVKAEINAVLAASDVLIFKGTIGTGGNITALPTSGYLIGWSYKVITIGTYAGQACEIGDMIICINNFDTTFKNSDWTIVQSNLDGIVIGPVNSIDARIAIFNGTTGKLIKDSGYTVSDIIYTHPSYDTKSISIDTDNVDVLDALSITSDATGHVTAITASTRTLPSASSTVTGVLSSTDWTTFNSKIDSTANTVTGYIPSWGNDGKTLSVGYNVETTAFIGGNNSLVRADILKTYVDGIVEGANALVYKDSIDCSSNPDYPSANKGHLYKVSVAGKIGGPNGVNVEVGDMIICNTDLTIAGNQNIVGSKWDIIQSNIEVSTLQPKNANLTAISGLTGTGIAVKTGTNTWTNRTISAGTAITITNGDGTAGDITVAHTDTSTQNSVTNTGRTYIQSVTLDEMGHITGLTSASETDQNLFSNIKALNNSGNNVTNSPYTATSTTDSLQLKAGTNVTLDMNVSGVITISSSFTDTNTATAADDILDGSNTGTEIKYKPYTTQQNILSFDTSTTKPTKTDRLNLNGYFYATQLYDGDTRVLSRKTSDTTVTNQKFALFDTTSGDIIRSSLTFNDSTTTTTNLISASQINDRIINNKLVSIVNKTANYTLASADSSSLIKMNASTAVTVTVPKNTTVNIPVGSQYLLMQYSDKEFSIVAESGVTLLYPSDLILEPRDRYSTIGLLKIDTDEWIVTGDLSE